MFSGMSNYDCLVSSKLNSAKLPERKANRRGGSVGLFLRGDGANLSVTQIGGHVVV